MSPSSPTASLIVGPGFKTNISLYPGFPLNPNVHVPHAAFAGRDLIELDFNSATGVLKLAGLARIAINWFYDGSLYFFEAPSDAPEYIMALARTSLDKLVLLPGDVASHRASLVRARFSLSRSPSHCSTPRLAQGNFSTSRRTSRLILSRAARRLLRSRRLMQVNMFF